MDVHGKGPHPTNQPNLKVLAWNCAGLKQKLALLSNTVRRDCVDVILLQETFFSSPPTIKGYTGYHINAVKGPGRGRPSRGTTTFVSNTIHSAKVAVGGANPAADVLRVRPRLANCTVDLFNVYNPFRTKFTINPILQGLGRTVDHQIIMGDFNLHHSAWGRANVDSAHGCALLAEILNAGTHSILNDGSPTYRAKSSIDLCILDSRLATTAVWEQTHLYSDHHAALLHTRARKVELPPATPRLNLNKTDWAGYNKRLEELAAQDPPSTCEEFNRLAHQALHDNTPHTTPSKRPGSITSGAIRRAKRFTNKLLRKLRTNPNRGTENLVHITQAWAKDVELAEKDRRWKLWCAKIGWHTSTTQLWKKVNSLQGNTPRPPLVPDPDRLAAELITKFTDRTDPALSLPAGHRRSLAANSAWREDLIDLAVATPAPRHLDDPIRRPELNRALDPPRKRTTPGADGVPTVAWTKMSNANRTTLLPLINHVFCEAAIPQSWRDANIVPIPKKSPGESRPISLLETLGKVTERIVHTRLEQLTEDPVNGLPEEVFGFRKGRGTQNAITTLLETANQQRAKGAHVAIIFLDLEKAFELVDHTVVLASLCRLGVTGRLLAFIRAYLENRRARVCVQGIHSQYVHLKNGVPQGAVLSPLLFNAVMAALVTEIKTQLARKKLPQASVLCYADDIAITCAHRTNVEERAAEVLNLVGAACRGLGLKISAAKTKALLLHQSPPPRPLLLDGERIEWVAEFDYLGVRLDRNLNMDALVQNLAARMRKRLLIMCRISGFSWGAPSAILGLFYRQAVRALFDYAATTIAATHNSVGVQGPRRRAGLTAKSIERNFTTLERVQYQAARIITRAPGTTRVEILLLEAGLPPLQLRCQQALANHLTKLLTRQDTSFSRKAAAYLEDPRRGAATLSWDTRRSITKLKASHGLRLADSAKPRPRPPWYTVPAVTRTTDISTAKRDYSTAALKALAQESIAQAQEDFPLATTVYTDGSLNPDSGRAGAGMVIPADSVKRVIRVNDFASTLDTELAAIDLALAATTDRSCLIVSDSLNAIRDIVDPGVFHSGAADIQDIIINRHRNNLSTVLLWMPSHIGLAGNDLADKAALEGAGLPAIDRVLPPSISKLQAANSRTTKELWETSLGPTKVRNPYSISWVWHNLVRKTLPPPTNLPATTQVAATRFRSGYRRWIDVPDLQRCPCGDKIFNVAHILATCKEMDRSAILDFMDPNDHRSDTRAAKAILTRMAKTSWEPLARFYRQNRDVIESVGPPAAVDSDHEDDHQV